MRNVALEQQARIVGRESKQIRERQNFGVLAFVGLFENPKLKLNEAILGEAEEKRRKRMRNIDLGRFGPMKINELSAILRLFGCRKLSNGIFCV
jgi:hypothetical protein